MTLELTPLGYFALILGCVAISVTAYDMFFYDEHQQNPHYCQVYAEQTLVSTWDRPANPEFVVKENVAKESCTTPHWDFICDINHPELRDVKTCWVARSEPKFQILGVK